MGEGAEGVDGVGVAWDTVDAVAPAFVGGEDGEDAELGAYDEFRCAVPCQGVVVW